METIVIKKDDTRKSEFYRWGEWVIEIEEYEEKWGPVVEMYIGLHNMGHRMFCVGLCLEQPEAKDGKTHYTKEEATDILLDCFPDYMDEFFEEVDALEAHYEEDVEDGEGLEGRSVDE